MGNLKGFSVHVKKPRNLCEVEKIEEWYNLDPHLFQRLYESIPTRINLSAKVKGRRI